ncbi:hypothetical protein TWF730_003914 [Orbilia blumenaviensis]|uniref:Uncharacterized protein n=1 Tax=Orbilia blumenaviensis TaxID=1796055 RepID=A0AAV9U2T9_9PEZI
MKFSRFTLLAGLLAVTSASPILQYYNVEDNDVSLPLEGRDLPVEVCRKIQTLVNLLKIQKATPFCSSFLKIGTQTSLATQVLPTTVTSTQNAVAYTTVTIVDRTNTLSFQATETIATSPTVVETSTVTSTSVVVSTVTPAPSIVTTTVYELRPVKRDIEEREIGAIPAFLRGFASSAISQACSCLAIPSPVITQTITQYATETAFTTLTATSTNTALSTTETSITNTVYATLYVPTTTVVTSVATSTSLTTIPQAVSTSTVYQSLPTECVNIVSGNKLYTQAAPGRNIEPSSDLSVRRFYPERNDYTLSQCCGHVYQNVKDVGVFFFSDRGSSAGKDRYVCAPWVYTSAVATGVSASCPSGVLADNVPSVSGGGPIGFGLGPCFGRPRIQ